MLPCPLLGEAQQNRTKFRGRGSLGFGLAERKPPSPPFLRLHPSWQSRVDGGLLVLNLGKPGPRTLDSERPFPGLHAVKRSPPMNRRQEHA